VPGKRKLELALIRRPTVLNAVNKIRDRFGREALLLPPHGGADGDARLSGERKQPSAGGKDA